MPLFYYNREAQSIEMLDANLPKYLPNGKKQIVMYVGMFAVFALIVSGVWIWAAAREFGNDMSGITEYHDVEGYGYYMIFRSREELPEGFAAAGIVGEELNDVKFVASGKWQWLAGKTVYASQSKPKIIYIYDENYAKNPWIIFKKIR